MYQLKGKVAIVTGAARGIGFHTVKILAANGVKVFAVDLNEKVLELDVIQNVFPHVANAADEDAVKAYVKQVHQQFGKIDILVNNAGITLNIPLIETQLEDWDKALNTNARGYFLNTRTVLPIMQKSKGGSIVNVSSIVGSVGMELTTAYAASKGAINQLTKVTAIEGGKFGIRANAVSPGVVETDILEGIVKNSKETLASYGSSHLLGRVSQPEEIADVITFLCSPKSSAITGAIIAADGGYTTV